MGVVTVSPLKTPHTSKIHFALVAADAVVPWSRSVWDGWDGSWDGLKIKISRVYRPWDGGTAHLPHDPEKKHPAPSRSDSR